MTDHLMQQDEAVNERYVVTVVRKATVVKPSRKEEYVGKEKTGTNNAWAMLETTVREVVETVVFQATVPTQPSVRKLAELIDGEAK